MAAAYEPPVSDKLGELVIRPSWRAVAPWNARALGLGALLVVAGSARLYQYGVGPLLLFLGIFAVSSVGYALYQAVYMTSTSITVTADAIIVTHWYSSTARVDPKAIARVVRCSVDYLPNERSRRPVIFAFSPSGRCVLSLYAERWGQEDLDRIWRHLGVAPEGTWNDLIHDLDLDTRFPGAF
jgi:hypothetical protein